MRKRLPRGRAKGCRRSTTPPPRARGDEEAIRHCPRGSARGLVSTGDRCARHRGVRIETPERVKVPLGRPHCDKAGRRQTSPLEQELVLVGAGLRLVAGEIGKGRSRPGGPDGIAVTLARARDAGEGRPESLARASRTAPIPRCRTTGFVTPTTCPRIVRDPVEPCRRRRPPRCGALDHHALGSAGRSGGVDHVGQVLGSRAFPRSLLG
jgi:hypothetical protein